MLTPTNPLSAAAAVPTAVGTGQHELVADELMAKYAELIYKQTGIRISPQKKILLSNRVRRRLRATGVPDFGAYFLHLQRLNPLDPEWDAFLQEITTHETYLFRDEVHWGWFRNTFLPEHHRTQGATKRRLRVWSAAASTGDEAATIACCIADCLPNWSQQSQVQIVATDIGVGALEQAKAGTFNERAMRLVPDDYKQKFFTKAIGANIWQLKPALLSKIQFKQHNLMDPLRVEPFDVVFVKNVLIYFDTESKKKVLGHIKQIMQPQGYLVAGAAEGISDLVRDLRRVQPWLFQRPDRDTRSA
ncbi:MAG: protein-glutamate O-methyltransferase CheR [Pirellulales bacterium]|nr:protein-glutamate O-methyltransferase CheR [Pirellulales bacterium]